MPIKGEEQGVVVGRVSGNPSRGHSIIGRERVAQKPDTGQRPLAVVGQGIKIPPLVGPRRLAQPAGMSGVFGGIKDKAHDVSIPELRAAVGTAGPSDRPLPQSLWESDKGKGLAA